MKTIFSSHSFLHPHPPRSHRPASLYRRLSLILPAWHRNRERAGCHKLKADFISPIVRPLHSRLLQSLCRSVLCGSDNESNYTGSMSEPRHSVSTGRLRHHDARCPAIALRLPENHCGRACTLSYGDTPGNEMVFVCFCSDIIVQRMGRRNGKPMDISLL